MLLTRRTFVGSAGIAPLWLLGNPLLMYAQEHYTVEVRPVTREWASVVVRLPFKFSTAQLTVQCGAHRIEADFIGAVAVTGLPVPKDAQSALTVSVSGSPPRTAHVDTRHDSLRGSLHRLVNKRIAIEKADNPGRTTIAHGVVMDVRCKASLDKLLSGAKKADAELVVISGCRGYDGQKKLYDDYKKRDGQAKADKFSARPGHSEHQLGLAFDVGARNGEHELDIAFGTTKAGRWVAAHAHTYGFVVRYPSGQTAVTGYEPEPWHIRFVGVETATYLHDHPTAKTLEQVFQLPPAPSY